ncbi:MAG TPA: SDR family oxidoreductase [Ktedonobacterales bacterium]|jgi:3-oxoacyl-[acyl-carrier protein] reductase|nr:SDR family oxidoreductase [Ktedonobacterales bacterium]
MMTTDATEANTAATNAAAGRLQGQVALITGASAGIGRAIAQAFMREGADLVVVARRAQRLEALAEDAQRLGRNCRLVTGDVRDEDTASRATQAALDHFGKLDILVNNAGVGIYKQLEETSPDDYDTMMDSNMRSTFLFTRYVVPVLTRQGAGVIINVSSMAGVMGFPGEAVYCATKFAQVGFTQALDRELRPRGIKVGVLCPGGVKTEFAIGTGRTAEGVAVSGMLEPEDVADAAVLMATQRAGSRIMEIRLRPMIEPLAGRDPE